MVECLAGLVYCIVVECLTGFAGLKHEDKDIVEELFVNNKIQVVICTSTLAWGVNFPAHLVIIKGTEFYDAKTHR